MKLYTYKNWWDGDVALITCPINFKEGEKPNMCSWEEIKHNDIQKIKAKQEEIFKLERNKLYTNWTKRFSENYKRSLLKKLYLERELNDYNDLLFSDITIETFENNVNLKLRNQSLLFKINQIGEVRNFIKTIIIQGLEKNYDFIHSPNFPYQNKNGVVSSIIIYAQTCFDYFLWLVNFQKVVEEKETEKFISKSKSKFDKKNFSLKQIAIAYCIMGIPIDKFNAGSILKKYSNFVSIPKLLQKRVYKVSDLTKISENKSKDTKHLHDLKSVKRLLDGINFKHPKLDIDHIISEFENKISC
jgi:hypothetical protein